jgi:hypothetical protein
MVCEDSERATIEHVQEMPDSQVAGKQFPVKSRVLLLIGLQLL